MAARCGCELLVDVNNIYVNALNERLAGRGIYPLGACIHGINQMPAHLVDCGDVVIDNHDSRVCNEVWQIYQHAQQRFGNVPALLEWDTDISPFAVLLSKVAMARAALPGANRPCTRRCQPIQHQSLICSAIKPGCEVLYASNALARHQAALLRHLKLVDTCTALA